jgi:hypothetical protein
MCDDHRRWAAGVNALARLRKMQQQLDRDGSIWLSYPGAHTHGAPAPLIAYALTKAGKDDADTA